jgi:hypothetical protein
MVTLDLYRTSVSGATIGRLEPLGLVTLEPPWKDNQRDISCIPSGIYGLRPYYSPKYGDCLSVHGGTVSLHDRAARSAVLIHAGNYPRQTSGCILPGITAGAKDGLPAVWSSRDALNRIIEYVGEFAELRISYD